jgi:hypothetical protein
MERMSEKRKAESLHGRFGADGNPPPLPKGEGVDASAAFLKAGAEAEACSSFHMSFTSAQSAFCSLSLGVRAGVRGIPSFAFDPFNPFLLILPIL